MENQAVRPAPSDVPATVQREQARIEAEFSGLGLGTDPFVSVVRATRMPMIITNPRLPDNPVVFANDAFCRLTGYKREAIVGRNCRFLQGPQTDPATVQRIREAVAAARPLEIDICNHRRDGEPFWNRLLFAPVHDAAGALAYFCGSQVDVTIERDRLAGLESHNAALMAQLNDRLRAQEDSEARLRFATQAGGLGIWEMDVRSGELTTSAICRENFGRDPQLDFTYADLRAAIHPADRERMAAAVAHSVTTGSDYVIEYRVNLPNDGIGWVDIRAQVVRAEDGTALRMAGTSLDITARKNAEARSRALLDLDDQFRALEDPAELGYAAAEALGRTLAVSRGGYGTVDPVHETITIERDWNAPGIKTLGGMLHFRDYGSYIEDLQRGETVIVANAASDPRTAGTAGQLETIDAQAFINMPITEQGTLVALFYVAHASAREWSQDDLAFVREVAHRTRMVVERRRAEQGLRRLAASLEMEVANRTEALMETEAALRQSQKMEAVGQLTGGIAHDFNNLLTGISGSLELLRTRIAQGRVAEVDRYVTAAQGAASRAAALTHRLLAFSRRQTLEPRATNVNRLVAGMEELIRRTVGPSITVVVEADGALWGTMVDPSQLENALLNLCINARDAMAGGGRLTITTANETRGVCAAQADGLAAGAYVSLRVSDTGTGMTEGVIAKAFDPFFTTKPIGQGTGLGLSMIYGFARQSGGEVRIQSAVGSGTTVCLTLPRHSGPLDEAQPVAQAAQPARDGRGETVLVVDDEPTVRMLLTDVMDDLGYHTVEASDGRAGVEVLQSDRRIDLLVTDVGLPGGLNGWQVAEAGRAVRPSLKVLFITGYAEQAALGAGPLWPGMHVLTKPFAVETLASRVKELIAG